MGMAENMIITAVLEETPGTLKADSASDVVKFGNDTKPPDTNVKWIDNPETSGTGTLSQAEGYTGPDEGGFDLTLMLRGSGYCNVASPLEKFLTSSGFNVVPGTGGVVADTPTPSTTVFAVTGASLGLAKNDIIMVDVSATETPTWKIARVTTVVNGTGKQTITVTPALSAAPTVGNEVVGQRTVKPCSVRSQITSLSMYHYLDGVKIANAGCRAGLKLDFKWGELAKAVFSFKPLTWTPTTATAGFTPDFAALQPPLMSHGGSFKVETAEEYVESISIDMGQNVARLGAVQSAGYYENFISARKVKGTFDPFAVNADHLTAYKAGTHLALWLQFGSGNNIFALSMPLCKRESVKFAEREKINTYALGFGAYGTAGDDEVVFAFCSPVTQTP